MDPKGLRPGQTWSQQDPSQDSGVLTTRYPSFADWAMAGGGAAKEYLSVVFSCPSYTAIARHGARGAWARTGTPPPSRSPSPYKPRGPPQQCVTH